MDECVKKIIEEKGLVQYKDTIMRYNKHDVEPEGVVDITWYIISEDLCFLMWHAPFIFEYWNDAERNAIAKYGFENICDAIKRLYWEVMKSKKKK